MSLNLESNVAIYLQIAKMIEDSIFDQIYKEEDKIPSTNEFAKLFNINPHTVLKGMNILVNENLIYKKRGLGMFVCKGALQIIQEKKRNEFYNNNVNKIVSQAQKLKIKKSELIEIIDKLYK